MWTGCTLLVRPDGSLLTVFNDSPVGGASGADTSIRVVSSSDGGTTWSPPVDVMPRQQVNRVPDAALSPDGSEVYVAWFDGWTDGMPFLSRSVNGGAFTTAPVVGAAPGTVQSLNVAVASDGTVGLLYNDMRHNPDSDHLITDVWLAQSPDQGATFAESHVAGPFDVAATSPVAGVGVGEWQGLRGAPRGFALAYTVVNPTGVSDPPVQAVQPSSVFSSNPTDIVFSRFTS
jgi:hypothetical protein